MTKLNTYYAVCSNHYPVEFEFVTGFDSANRPRRITKTLLQSNNLVETAKLYYDVEIKQTNTQLEDISSGGRDMNAQEVDETFIEMERLIKLPWFNQANKRRKHTPAH